jgi:4'-phosphopantetheinyl transferase
MGPLGIDVESTRRVPPHLLDLDVLSEAERDLVEHSVDPVRAFLAIWVRKEALVKAGVTTLGQFRSLDLSSATRLPVREDEDVTAWRWRGLVLNDWRHQDAAVGCLVARSQGILYAHER